MINGDTYKVRGTITVLSADNFSAQLKGGYEALHAALRKCCYCMAIDDDMQRKVGLKHMIMLINKSHFSEQDFQLRTINTYNSYCKDLGVLHNHMATSYRIVQNSILNSTMFFHVVTGLPIDIIHDLEGSLQLAFKKLLNDLIFKKGCFLSSN